MIIRRRRRAEIPQRCLAVVFQAVRLAGWDEHSSALANPRGFMSHGHDAIAYENELDLLRPMTMQALLAAGFNDRQRRGQVFRQKCEATRVNRM